MMFGALKGAQRHRVREPAVAGVFYLIRGLLKAAQQRGLQAKTVDLRNSGDTSGTKDQVVGYGSYVLYWYQDESSTDSVSRPGDVV